MGARPGVHARFDMTARIACVAEGLPSVLYPSVELARRLAADGHHVTCVAHPGARELIEHHGLEFRTLPSHGYDDFLATDGRTSALSRLRDLRDRRRRAVESLATDEFLRAISAVEPDLVLINGEMHERIIALSTTGLQIALLNTFVSIWRRPGLPPPHCMVRPGVGWMGTTVGTSLLWSVLQVKKWQRVARHRVHHVGCDRVSVLRQLARQSDFDRETDANQWLIPFTYRRLPVLSLHASEFEFPHRQPNHVHYVGPMVLASRIDRRLYPADEARLEAILDRRRSGSRTRRLVYAGFGSVFSADLDLVHRAIGIVERRPEWELVISLSDRVTSAEVGRVPERVHVFNWVPQMRVLRAADVAVTHGGINTIDECVISRVPTLVYCGRETDMAGTTARVVHHGLGIAGDRGRDDTSTMCEHIDRLLTERRFSDNLERFERLYSAYAENRIAERTIESLLRREDDDRTS